MPHGMTRQSRRRLARVAALVAVAGCCAATLQLRVYDRFDRVRIRVVRSTLSPVDGVVVVPVPEVAALADAPAALILRLRNRGVEARTVEVAVNGSERGRVVVGSQQSVRVDLVVPARPGLREGDQLRLASHGDDWDLEYLELANIHGFSLDPFSFVITPTAATPSARPSGRARLLLFGLLLVGSIAVHRSSGLRRGRLVALLPATAIAGLLGVILLLPLVSAYMLLLSVQAFSICLAALYGPATVLWIARAAGTWPVATVLAGATGASRTWGGVAVASVGELVARIRPGAARIRRVLPVLVVVAGLVGYTWVLLSHTSFAVGGADSSGYLSFAQMIADGETSRPIEALDRLGLEPEEYRNAFIPLGWRDTPWPDRMAPVFPGGLPIQMLLMALVFGWETGPFLVSPLSAVLGLWLMYRLGRRLSLSRIEAAAGAAILAVWPVYLFIGVQPMSDVNSAVWCMAAACLCLSPRHRGADVGAGLALGMAVLIRSTNVLLVVPLLVAVWGQWPRVGRMILGGLPCAVVLLSFNALAYGHPLTTGNGFIMAQDFGLEYAATNVTTYGFWLLGTLGPVVLAAVLVPFDRGLARRTRLFLVSWCAGYFAFYALFKSGEAFWWTRYLLPAVPAIVIAGLIVLRDGAEVLAVAVASRSLPPVAAGDAAEALAVRPARVRRIAGWLLGGTVAAVLATCVWQTDRLDALGIAEGESVYPLGVQWAEPHLPDRALILSTQMGTAVEAYSDNTAVRWEPMSPGRFDQLRRATESLGYRWFALLYPEETARVRELTGAEWLEDGQFRQVSLWRLAAPAASPGRRLR